MTSTDYEDVPPLGLADGECYQIPTFRLRSQGITGYEETLEEYMATNTSVDSAPDIYITGTIPRARVGTPQCSVDTSETNTTARCTVTRKITIPSFEHRN